MKLLAETAVEFSIPVRILWVVDNALEEIQTTKHRLRLKK